MRNKIQILNQGHQWKQEFGFVLIASRVIEESGSVTAAREAAPFLHLQIEGGFDRSALI